MKKLLLLHLILIIATVCKAQFITINFETPDSLVNIDTTIANNIWQISVPAKTFFDSAYSAPNAIVTDTLNFYPDTNLSSFTIMVWDPSWMFWDPSIGISFWHKFDTDSLQDGGYIEVSVDSGATWTNIVNAWYISLPWPLGGTFYYDSSNFSNPIIANGQPAFTGRSDTANGGWQFAQFGWCFPPVNWADPYPIFVRFTFSSDSVHHNKEGWMIDDLQIWYLVCEGIKENVANNLISVYPNPSTDQLFIKRKDDKISASIRVIDLLGTLIFEDKNFTAESINTRIFKPGVYLLRFQDAKNICVKKFVVE